MRGIASEFADQLGIKHTETAGYDWIRFFLSRNTHIRPCKNDASSLARLKEVKIGCMNTAQFSVIRVTLAAVKKLSMKTKTKGRKMAKLNENSQNSVVHTYCFINI